MAEVGVLNLTIKDNSGEAAEGLRSLAGALSSVKSKVSGGLGLAGVKQELTAFTRSINAAKTTSVVFQGIAAFGKGLADISRVVKASADGFDTSKIVAAIENIKGAVGEGMHLGTAGTQIKNIREALTGEWKTDNAYNAGMALAAIGEGARSMDGASLGTKAKGISAVAKAISEYADAAQKVQMALNIGKATVEIGQNVTAGAAQGMESQQSAVEQAASQIGNAIINAIRDTLGIHSPSKVTEEQGRYAGIGLANGLMAVKSDVQAAAGSVADTIQQVFYSKLNLMNFANSPVQNMLDAFRPMAAVTNDYKTAVNAVLPKVQEMSSEEMLIAGNARMATEAIGKLIDRLDAVPNPKGKGFSEYVEAVTGVTRGKVSPIINENTTMFKPLDTVAEQMEQVQVSTESAAAATEKVGAGTGTLAENAKAAADSMERVSSAVQEGVSLMDIPASGKNGAFANAAEEMKYLTEEIEKAKLAQQQFSDIEAKAAKQLKYGGPMSKNELEFNLQHATEGYYKAVEAADAYQKALDELKAYAAAAAEEIKKSTAAVEETQKAMATSETPAVRGTGSIKGIYDDTRFGPTLAGLNGAEEQMALIQDMARGTGLSIDEIKRQLTELSHGTIQFGGNLDRVAQGVDNVRASVESAGNTQVNFIPIDKYIEDYSHIEYLKNKIEELKTLLADRIKLGVITPDEIDNSVMKIRSLTAEVQKLQDEAAKTGFSFGALKAGIQKMFPTITGLMKRFQSMAKMRAMRYIIRQLAAGISEGLKNVYFYSKEVGTAFAPAMDSAASALAQMKNSIGAALAPAIQAMIPVLQTLVGWFVNLINYVNQFFALLNGQATWTRALATSVDAYEDKTKKAKGAAKEMKDLLADWDELNIIQSQGGGSGSGSSGKEQPNYGEMFEEVSTFSEGVQNFTQMIKDNMQSVKKIAKDIGVAILGWKMSKAFTGWLGTLGSVIAAGAIIELTWHATELVDKQYLKDGNTGWLVADILTNLVGGWMAGKLIAGVSNSGYGGVTMGLSIVASAGITYGIALANPENDRSGALKVISGIKAAIGTLLTGAGFTYVTGNAVVGFGLGALLSVPMFVATAAISYRVAVYEKYEEIAKQAFDKANENGIDVETMFSEIQKEFDRQTAGYAIVVDAFKNVPTLKADIDDAFGSINNLSGIVRGGDKLTKEEAEEFKEAWQTVFKAFEGITESSFRTVLDGLAQSLTSANENIRKEAKELRISALMMNENLTEAQAKFRERTMELEEKIGLGTATPEEIAEYEKRATAMAVASDTTYSAMEKLVIRGKQLDLSDATKVGEFIKEVGESSRAAYDSIDEGTKTAIEGIDVLRGRNKMFFETGEIGAEVYNANVALYDRMEANILAAAEDRKKEIEKTTQEAYNTVLDSALRGLTLLPKGANGLPGPHQSAVYLTDIVAPVVNQLKEAGAEIPQELEDAINNAYGLNDPVLSGKSPRYEKVVEKFVKGYVGGFWTAVYDTLGKTKIDDFNPADKPVDKLMSDMYTYLFNWDEQGMRLALFDAPIVAPSVDTKEYKDSIYDMADQTDRYVTQIRDSIESLNNIKININADVNVQTKEDPREKGPLGGLRYNMVMRASGGYVRSGDIVMANENGNFEMMGRMGNQPVVANNQQIITGISSGVAQANAGVESRLTAIEGLMQRLLQKEFVAKAIPTSSWGEHNTRSADAYQRVTG